MIDPMTASMAMTGLGGAAQLFGKKKSDNSAYNQALKMAAESKKESQQGFTDAEGNRYVFISGQGWTVIPASYDEQYQANSAQQQGTRNASKAMNEYSNTDDMSESDIYNTILSANMSGINKSVDSTVDSALKQANRTGSNVGSIVQAANSSKQKQIKDAITDANIQSRLGKNKINYDRKAPLMQTYQDNIGGYNKTISDGVSQFSNMNNSMVSAGNNLATMTGNSPRNDDSSFMSNFGSMLSGAGTALGNYSNYQESKANNAEMRDWMKQFLTGGKK